MFRQEILHAGGQLPRRPEGIPDCVSHPSAVGHGHVAAVYGSLQQEDPVQVVSPAPVQHLQQARDNPAVGVLRDDHRLVRRETGAVAVIVRLAEQRVLHLRNHDIHLVFDGIIGRLHIVEVAGDLQLPPVFLHGVCPGMIRQLAEVTADLQHLEFPVIPVERSSLRIAASVLLQPAAVMEAAQADSVPFRAQPSRRFPFLQPGGKLLHAAFAEAPAGADGRHGQLAFVQLDTGHARVNLDFHDLLQVAAPHRIVPAHLAAVLLVSLHFHPLGVDRVSVHIPGAAFLPEVHNGIALFVPDAVRIVVLQPGGERVRPFIAAELVQAVPAVSRVLLRPLVHAEDVPLSVRDSGVFPALYLENNPEEPDSPAAAFRDEIPVVHESVYLHAGIHFPERLMGKIRQADASAAQAGPGQHGGVVFFQVFQHLGAPQRQARMVAVVVFEPSVKIDAPFHRRPPVIGILCLLFPASECNVIYRICQ